MSEDEKLKIPKIDTLGSGVEPSAVVPADQVPGVITPSGPTDEELDEQLAFEQLERHRKQRRRKKRIRIAAAAALAVGAVAAWIITHPATQDVDVYQPITSFAYQGDFTTEVSSNGATEPLKLTVVTPEVDGIIQDVRVAEGQQVAVGDVLFTVKNDELDRAVTEAERTVSSAQSSLNSAYTSQSDAYNARGEAWDRYNAAYDQYKEDFKQYEKDLEAYPEKHAKWEREFEEYQEQLAQYNARFWAWYVARNQSQNKNENKDAPATDSNGNEIKDKTVSQYEEELYAEIETRPVAPPEPAEPTPPTPPEAPEDAALLSAIHGTEDGITGAAQGLESAQEALSDAQEATNKRTVKAPVAGTIISMNAVEGASTAGTQGSGALVQIADLTQMKVTVQVNEIDIRDIEVGQTATATFSALPGVELEAVVERIASMSSNSEGYYGGGVVTYAVDLLIPKPDPALKPGMTATVVIRTQHVEDTVIVPVSALVDNGDGTFSVYVVTDDETWESEERAVSVIAKNSSEAAVSGDIADGDQVIMGDAGYGDEGYGDEGYDVMIAYGG